MSFPLSKTQEENMKVISGVTTLMKTLQSMFNTSIEGQPGSIYISLTDAARLFIKPFISKPYDSIRLNKTFPETERKTINQLKKGDEIYGICINPFISSEAQSGKMNFETMSKKLFTIADINGDEILMLYLIDEYTIKLDFKTGSINILSIDNDDSWNWIENFYGCKYYIPVYSVLEKSDDLKFDSERRMIEEIDDLPSTNIFEDENGNSLIDFYIVKK